VLAEASAVSKFFEFDEMSLYLVVPEDWAKYLKLEVGGLRLEAL
jgi:hypothetical protein